MLTTAAVIHLVAFTYPSALAALRLCIFGGEVTNPATLELIFSELLVSEPGVSRGYYDGDIRTAASFPSINSATEFNCAATAATAQTTRWYRTGDIVRCSDNDEGGLEFVGWRNNQVKIGGFHVELEAVEAALRGTSLLADAVALKFDVPAAGAGSLLVKLRDSGVDEAETGTAMLNLAEEVTKAVRLLLPDYMVPRLHPSFCHLLCQYNTRF
ncbi:hypothetical protein HBI81_162880 [Parastagonospora nodorum]|nr:hypothetical protein HBH51_216710 [Parastagonospora nodorum]KAH3967393.1 hypothetical protein HBH52_185940 [Parastagonospora nodorum]KAH4062667.1 hypothetical protein HBH50_199510 [Parastagonospora nodorum]KAH4081428.1 hypothetical protein HBH48_195160 [Parastagonospora nodorum]KAH5179254.1 hypothetical protein HBH76_181170 [Parastagonospora nodorum]